MSSGRVPAGGMFGSGIGVALFAVLACSAPGSAQQVDEQARARAAFVAADAAFEVGAYDDALTHFQRAWELAPTDVVRFNIAVCLERLGRLRESRDLYRELAASASLRDRERARARAAAEALEPRLGLLIVAQPVGGEVRIDGRLRCTVPCRESIEPGLHWLALDGSSSREQVDVPSGSITVSLSPVAESVPPDATVTASARATASRELTPLFWTGVGLSGLALSGAIYFGVRTEELRSQFVVTPTEEIRADGLTHRDLTNASLVLLGVGLSLVVVDVVWWWLEQPRSPSTVWTQRTGVRF